MTPPCRCHSAPDQPPCAACLSARRPRLLPQPIPFAEPERDLAAIYRDELAKAGGDFTLATTRAMDAWLFLVGAK